MNSLYELPLFKEFVVKSGIMSYKIEKWMIVTYKYWPMVKITISLSREDEKLLRSKAKKNFRSISGEISYIIHKVYGSEK